MPEKLDAPMPDNVVIGGGWRLEWAAVDPATGTDVAGVNVTKANVVATDLSNVGDIVIPEGGFKLVPGPGS